MVTIIIDSILFVSLIVLSLYGVYLLITKVWREKMREAEDLQAKLDAEHRARLGWDKDSRR